VGIVYVRGTVIGPKGSRNVRFLVDSGASYSLLPEPVWTKIGLAPKREMQFEFADGSIVTRNVSQCQFQILEEDVYSPVILGERDDEALLGVITLEVMGLVLNPFKRKLQPLRLMLASAKEVEIKSPKEV